MRLAVPCLDHGDTVRLSRALGYTAGATAHCTPCSAREGLQMRCYLLLVTLGYCGRCSHTLSSALAGREEIRGGTEHQSDEERKGLLTGNSLRGDTCSRY